MKWKKKGLIYAPDKKFSWRALYGMMPTPVYLEGQNVLRVFFGTTDEQRFGCTTYLDLNPENPSEILFISDEKSLDVGKPGTFDDSGAVPSSIIQMGNEFWMYYVGFQRCGVVPYMLFPGLAQSSDGKTFTRYSEAPVIDRNKEHFISFAAPYVMKEDNLYKMWLWIGHNWTKIRGKDYIQASIGYAESNDGISWKILKDDCISIDPATEFSVGRPYIIKRENKYFMFHSVRYIDKLYRLTYAVSDNGKDWIRKDDIGIDVAESGWDSEMTCYPAVVTIKDKTYLFYNGNNNGETGFGYAELISW